MRMEPANAGGTMARLTTNLGSQTSVGNGPTIMTPEKRFREALQGARGRLRQTNRDLCVVLAVEACAGDSMRHTEAMILAVTLLSKRPDTLHTYLLVQERSTISQTYAVTQQQRQFKLLNTRREGI
jgi:hypothetical protein